MSQTWNYIKELADANNGIIKTSQVEKMNISRVTLCNYVSTGKLERVSNGIYVLANEMADEYALLQSRSKWAIFSYGTALYLWGLSDRVPHFYDITLPRGANVGLLLRDNPDLRCHHVKKEIYELGITETTSPQGSIVRLYDKERCICDLIRSKEHIDMQIYTQAIKDYFRSNPNIRKLLKYSKTFKIEDKIRMYMEVLQ